MLVRRGWLHITLRVLGWVLLIPALLLIAYTHYRVIADDGWLAYQNFMSPFNVRNYFTMMLLVAPAALAFYFADKVKP